MNDSKQTRDERRRDIEKQLSEAKTELQTAQNELETERAVWIKKLEGLDEPRKKVEERHRGFNIYVENNKSAGVNMNQERVDSHLKKLSDELMAEYTKRNDLIKEAEEVLKSFAAKTDIADFKVKRAMEELAGADEYEKLVAE